MHKIAKIEAIPVPPRWIFVKVTTDQGLVGWGEAIVPKRKKAICAAVEDMAQNILGRNAFEIEDISQALRKGSFFRHGPVLSSALAGIEIALWDIKARALNVPLWELFGGATRNKMRSYAWIGGDEPSDVVNHAQERLDQGFTLVKLNATRSLAPLGDNAEIDALVERLDSLRSAYGRKIDIAIDLHGRVPRSALKPLIKEVEPFNLSWIEEPCTPENLEALTQLAKACPHIPIATGERLATAWEFKPLLDSGAVDIVQPDISMTGIGGLKRIAQLAELYDVSVAPHSPNGPICLAASLQLGFCQANVAVQETSWGLHYNKGYSGLGQAEMSDYLVDASPLSPVNGWISRPEGVGLGIEVREDVVAAASLDWSLKDADWRHEDGSWAEW